MNKQWIYRNGEKPFSVTEIKTPNGEIFFTSAKNDGDIFIHNPTGGIRHYSGDHSLDLIPYEPYADFKIDDKVYVKDVESDMNPMPGHFAGLNENGQPTTFLGGCTSFTCSGTIRWNFCEKAKKEDK
jgi:hypothetical protein